MSPGLSVGESVVELVLIELVFSVGRDEVSALDSVLESVLKSVLESVESDSSSPWLYHQN